MFKSFIFGLLVSLPAFATENIKLTSSNTVTIRGFIEDESITKAMQEVAALAKARKSLFNTIYIVLDTPGGSIESGETFINYVKTVPNVKTITIFAASMGSAIVEALPGTRYITDDGILMFHRARAGFSGQIEMGEVESRLAWVKSIVLRMENRNAKRMGMSLAAYKSAVKDELWLTSEQALSGKAADRLVNLSCSPQLIEAKETSEVHSFFGSYKITMSKCPLFRYPLALSEAQ